MHHWQRFGDLLGRRRVDFTQANELLRAESREWQRISLDVKLEIRSVKHSGVTTPPSGGNR